MENLEPFDLWTTGKGENRAKLEEPLRSLKNILSMVNRDIYRLVLADRKTLLNRWENEVYVDMVDKAFHEIQKNDGIGHQITDVYDEVDRRSWKQQM